jgi:polyhydroxyalkanoate synthesis regulator phasin
MVTDGLKAYVQLASGLTDVTRERALAAARTLVAQGEAGVGAVLPDAMRLQVQSVTDDLIATSKANRDLMVGLVRAEVERSVSRLGLVSAAELNAATRRAESLDDRVHELERALRTARGSASGGGSASKRTTKKSTARKSTAKKSSAKKSTAKKSTAKKSTATKSSAKKSTAKTSTGKRSTAKKSTAKRSTAKRSTAKKSGARKSTAGKTTGTRASG